VAIAIALTVVDEHAFGAGRKFGFRAIATQSSTDAIAVFRFSRKAIALPSHSDQGKAIAPKKNDMIKYYFLELCRFL
jgi:hypothetical protein